jgi:hypothetical protein
MPDASVSVNLTEDWELLISSNTNMTQLLIKLYEITGLNPSDYSDIAAVELNGTELATLYSGSMSRGKLTRELKGQMQSFKAYVIVAESNINNRSSKKGLIVRTDKVLDVGVWDEDNNVWVWPILPPKTLTTVISRLSLDINQCITSVIHAASGNLIANSTGTTGIFQYSGGTDTSVETPYPQPSYDYVNLILGGNKYVYSAPYTGGRYFIKMNPVTNTLQELTTTAICDGSAAAFMQCIMGNNGYIYAIPGTAARVAVINTETDAVSLIGPIMTTAYTKYSFGIKANNGKIYCIPRSRMNQILEIDTINNTASLIGTAFTTDTIDRFRYVCGVLAPNGNIYYIPDGAMATKVLKVIPQTTSVSYVEIGNSLGATVATSHLVVGNDGNLYGFPNGIRYITKILPDTDVVTTVGPDFGTSAGKFLYTVCGSDGTIYGIPYNHNNAMRYMPDSNTFATYELSYQPVASKHMVAIFGVDNNLYLFPGLSSPDKYFTIIV